MPSADAVNRADPLSVLGAGFPAPPPARRTPSEGEMAPAMPPEAPLPMPVQDLRRWDPAAARSPGRDPGFATPWAARAFVFGGALALTVYGTRQMYEVISVSGGATALQ